MSGFQEWQLLFQQVYDGAYRYYDRCGEFMSLLRSKFGFMPLNITPNTCDMDEPGEALRIQANAEGLIIITSNPQKRKSFLEVIDFACTQATEMFEPFRVHQNRMNVSSYHKTLTQEESFEMSLRQLPESVTDLAQALEMVPLSQNFAFTFSSGSRVLTFTLQPVVTNITAAQRQLAQFGAAKSVIEHLAKRENLAKEIQPPSYGFGFDTSLIENEPPVKTNSEDMLDFLQRERIRILELLKPKQQLRN
jgi:hypothetical protein